MVDGSGSSLRVMDFALFLMRFLLICGSLGVLPLSMAEKYWPSYCSPAGVWYDEGLVERYQCQFLSFMLCACNYLCLMWMDDVWVGLVMFCLGIFDQICWAFAFFHFIPTKLIVVGLGNLRCQYGTKRSRL